MMNEEATPTARTSSSASVESPSSSMRSSSSASNASWVADALPSAPAAPGCAEKGPYQSSQMYSAAPRTVAVNGTRRTFLPMRVVHQAQEVPSAYRGLTIPPDSHETFLYPQTLWADHIAGRTDRDRMTRKKMYNPAHNPRPEIGKYVPDPNVEDFSNPKYMAGARETPVGGGGGTAQFPRSRSQSRSRSSSRARTTSLPPTSSSYTTMRSSSQSTNGDAADDSPPLRSTIKVSHTVVEPIYPCSAASFFFPIYYSRPSDQEKRDTRGTPENVNQELHPNDRCDMQLSGVSIQMHNVNRMGLYKVGPGAVAFKSVISAFEVAGLRHTSSNELFNILWAKRATSYTLASLNPYQKVNHFPGTFGVGRKDRLAFNTRRMQRHFGESAFDIVPASFLLPRERGDLERNAVSFPGTAESPLVYIMKPCASSCGRGITLHRGIPPMPRGGQSMVCQRYIGNPLLIYGRKFDLRLYCAIMSFDPLRIYIFDEGLVRFAAEKYVGADQDLDNIHVHLTNYSVNKTAQLSRESDGKDYDGDDPVDIKWCVSDFKKYLVDHHPLGAHAWDRIQADSDDVVIKTFLSIENEVVERVQRECKDRSGRNCFELFGLDLMVDCDLKVRLIEVNIMPSLATGSSLDKAVKSRMLAHLLTMVRAMPYRRDAPLEPHRSREYVPCGFTPHTQSRTYKFGNHPYPSARIMERPLLRAFNNPEDSESVLSTDETLLLVEAEEELRCAGGFRRIFPVASTVHRYLPYYLHGVRRNTYLLASAVMMRETAERCQKEE